jgi:transposase
MSRKNQPETRPEFRLTEREVAKIKELRQVHQVSAVDIAKRFGVNTFTIYRVLRISDAPQRREKGAGQAEKPSAPKWLDLGRR